MIVIWLILGIITWMILGIPSYYLWRADSRRRFGTWTNWDRKYVLKTSLACGPLGSLLMLYFYYDNKG